MLVGVAAGGCISQPVTLDFTRASQRDFKLPPDGRERPSARLLPLVDLRADASIMGAVGRRPVTAAETARWLQSELENALLANYRLGSADGSLITIEPVLHKLYVSSVDITKTAVVVIELRITDPGGRNHSRHYRGQHASMNWNSTEGEILQAVQAAVRQCMNRIKAEAGRADVIK